MSDVLEKLLPTTLSKMITGTTGSLTLSAPFLAEGLQKLGLTIEFLTKPEVRLLLAILVLSFGLFALVVHLILYTKDVSKNIEILADKNQTIKIENRDLKDELKNCESRRQFLENLVSANTQKAIRKEKDFVEKHNSDMADFWGKV
ncbi:hypothetical protein [Methylomicrobium lacus]|uniref:hypothetical protein n=1 Tax=Methylomicrobium lacus TaxID=136992 RepID=UPI0035A86DB6